MANNYQLGSFAFTLTRPQSDWLSDLWGKLNEDTPYGQPNQEQADLLDDEPQPGFCLELEPYDPTDPNSLVNAWIYEEEWLNTNHVASVLQALLTQFPELPPIGFETAHTCSKPRIDEFGGCAYLITKDRVYAKSTWEAFEDLLLEAEQDAVANQMIDKIRAEETPCQTD